MKTIICLFCNKNIPKVDSDLHYFYCQKCNVQYYYNNNDNIYTFNIKIGDFFIYYFLEDYNCNICFKYDFILNLPMEQLLLPISELKQKINTIISFI